jgi:hypothetical protein
MARIKKVYPKETWIKNGQGFSKDNIKVAN